MKNFKSSQAAILVLNWVKQFFPVPFVNIVIFCQNPSELYWIVLTLLTPKNFIQCKNSLKWNLGCFWSFQYVGDPTHQVLASWSCDQRNIYQYFQDTSDHQTWMSGDLLEWNSTHQVTWFFFTWSRTNQKCYIYTIFCIYLAHVISSMSLDVFKRCKPFYLF